MKRLSGAVLSAAIVVVVSVVVRDILETYVFSKDELEGWELQYGLGAVVGFEAVHSKWSRDRGTTWYAWLFDKLFLAVMWAGAGTLITVGVNLLFGGFEPPSTTALVAGGLGLIVVAMWELSFRLDSNQVGKLQNREHDERMVEARRIAHENVERLTQYPSSDSPTETQPPA